MLAEYVVNKMLHHLFCHVVLLEELIIITVEVQGLFLTRECVHAQ